MRRGSPGVALESQVNRGGVSCGALTGAEGAGATRGTLCVSSSRSCEWSGGSSGLYGLLRVLSIYRLCALWLSSLCLSLLSCWVTWLPCLLVSTL